MRRRISQRAARAALKRVKELELLESERKARWQKDYPGGVRIGEIDGISSARSAVIVARKLGHYVIAVADENVAGMRLFAVPQ